MTTVQPPTDALIALHHLGTPKKIYRSHMTSLVIGGFCFITFALIWIAVTFLMTRIFSLIQAPFQNPSFSSSPDFQNPSFSSSPDFQNPSFSSPPDSPITTIFTILGIIFSSFGLIFLGVGLLMITKAIRNRHVQAVLCERGVLYLGRKITDAFRWEEVATVLDKLNVHTSTTQQPYGNISTSTTTSHTYIVACKDGRRFIFDRVLRQVEQLGMEIQIAVALSQKSL